ncbi:MAG: HAMP domain-containing protein [Gammaproteobacteria bacterium]|nr:HAMP domain-containing protein [Gammaproteobacteria bacterium]
MGLSAVSRTRPSLAPVLLLGALLLATLVLMSNATGDSDRFGALYSLLILINAVGLVIFLILIARNLRNLIRELRERAPGARLKLRMLTMTVGLAVLPVVIVYVFSVRFIGRGIDAWFDVRVDQALRDSLELSQNALELRMREALRTMEVLAAEQPGSGEGGLLAVGNSDLEALRRRAGAEEIALLDQAGSLLAASSTATEIVPDLPARPILLQLAQGRNYVGLDPTRGTDLYIRVAVNVTPLGVGAERRVLHGLFPIVSRLNDLARNVELALAKYTELVYLRDKLKLSFSMTLTLVLLFSLFLAIWFAFYSAERLSAPIRDLAMGTRSVAEGDYETILPVSSHDELGFLVSSFNTMTRRIARARDEVNAQHAYVETVLSKLSSGVLTLDQQEMLITANDSASHILGVSLAESLGRNLDQIAAQHRILRSFVEAIRPQLHDSRPDWQKEFAIFGDRRKVLLSRGTRLPGEDGQPTGHIIVFDDVTGLIQGQREAAWSEVARRLAHEIKNPLTPIQLSAERLRHKYLRKLPPDQTETLDRLTNTIIQQVETMKTMVNAFTEYARPPRIQAQPIDVNDLLLNVVELYRSAYPAVRIETAFDPELPLLPADGNRLRQVLNNLIANAIEALPESQEAVLRITTRHLHEQDSAFAEIRIEDNGTGISADILDNIFEPYVSNKKRGTGLGLAIVKKIVEEHGGMVNLENKAGAGAIATVRLPLHPVTEMTAQRSIA